MPLLDTTFLIGLEKRPNDLRAFLEELNAEGEPLLVSVQSAIELATGAVDPAEAMRKLREAFAVVPMGPEVGVTAARMARASFKRGGFPGWGDIQIAATAHHEGMAIVSANGKHLAPLGVRVRSHP